MTPLACPCEVVVEQTLLLKLLDLNPVLVITFASWIGAVDEVEDVYLLEPVPNLSDIQIMRQRFLHR